MNMCVVTFAMVILVRDFGLYAVIFMTMCIYYFRFYRHSRRAILK
jgi:hypothetical protein